MCRRRAASSGHRADGGNSRFNSVMDLSCSVRCANLSAGNFCVVTDCSSKYQQDPPNLRSGNQQVSAWHG